ncbi:MAG: 3-deoxy-D-manno-octulosonic acid transferase [Candidatus Omnitrophica bacterium]|nr:3-deoxy-D-manno-octulosonic acid transferase [Candidatus Omnitrophota bacterium]
MMWFLYELALVLGFLAYLPKALWRRRLPHRGWAMRLGRYPAEVRARLAGRPALWLHAVSVGEVLAAAPLVQALGQAYPQAPIALSTVTAGGYAVAAKQYGASAGVAPLYFPLDLRGCVARALETIRPRILLLMESELWPMAILLTKARGVPIAVVNGRISPRAHRRYRCMKRWMAGTLGAVDRFLMQSDEDARRLRELGVEPGRILVVGSLKWDASLGVRPSPQALRETAARLGLDGYETLIVAGSTHRGEEAPLLEAAQRLREAGRPVRLILAPRHLERLDEVEALVRQQGFSSARLSQPAGAPPWQVGLVDAFGQLPQYYALASVAFVGGSLIPHGGQNPLEPASQGKPVLFGPSMHNFADITRQLLAHRAARQLRGAEELAPALLELLERPADARAMGERALQLTERSQGATQRTLEALKPLL